MPWNKTLKEIRNVLAGLYQEQDDILLIISDAGLKPEDIKLGGRARNVWHSVLTQAMHRRKLQTIIDEALADTDDPKLKAILETNVPPGATLDDIISGQPNSKSKAETNPIPPSTSETGNNQPILTQYKLPNIRNLLLKGFTQEELRRFCYDENNFRPVYNQLATTLGPDEIVDKLIAYAESKVLLEKLLQWAKQVNPTRYEMHKPYTD